jgi:hypothetical protein
VIFISIFRLTLLRWLVILMFVLHCINPHATSHSFFQIISISWKVKAVPHMPPSLLARVARILAKVMIVIRPVRVRTALCCDLLAIATSISWVIQILLSSRGSLWLQTAIKDKTRLHACERLLPRVFNKTACLPTRVFTTKLSATSNKKIIQSLPVRL